MVEPRLGDAKLQCAASEKGEKQDRVLRVQICKILKAPSPGFSAFNLQVSLLWCVRPCNGWSGDCSSKECHLVGELARRQGGIEVVSQGSVV